MVELTGGRHIVPGGLAWDPTRNHLWVATFVDLDDPNLGLGGDGDIFEVDPVSRTVVSSFPTRSFTEGDGGFEGGLLDGLAYDSVTDTLWFSEDQAVNIYQSTTSGAFVSSFTLPLVPELWDAGLTFDGNDLWLAIRTGGFRGTDPGHFEPTFYEFSTGGAVRSLFSPPGGTTFGVEDIAYDPVTFAPKCALWLASHGVSTPGQLTAFEAPCEVITPRDLKANAIADLEAVQASISGGALGVGDPEEAIEEIAEAIGHIEESLDPELWATTGSSEIDPFRLNPEEGREVFHEERHAAQAIFDAIDDGEIENPALIDQLLAVVDILVKADRLLAKVAIDDAQADPDADPEEIAEALEDLAEGDQLVAEAAVADLDEKEDLIYEAIEDAYRHAWDAAIDAVRNS